MKNETLGQAYARVARRKKKALGFLDFYDGKCFRKKPSDEESKLQMYFVHWLDGLDILYCASAGGIRASAWAGAKLKKMGYKRGFPDIFIYVSKNGYNGLAVELKSRTGFCIEISERMARRPIACRIQGHDHAARIKFLGWI